MHDDALPFRPRVSSPVDRALASIEAQTLGVRRRVNRFVLERAVFVASGALLLAFAMLVGLAFMLSQTQFALGMWGVLSLLAFVVAASLRKARRAWMPKSGVALRIDRQADLQDRLATLASVPAQARLSKLWDVLLHENLGLLPRWEPRRLQPRATPQSIWFFVLSVVLALLASRAFQCRGGVRRAGGGKHRRRGRVVGRLGISDLVALERPPRRSSSSDPRRASVPKLRWEHSGEDPASRSGAGRPRHCRPPHGVQRRTRALCACRCRCRSLRGTG
jgi:hypothetical protein